MLEPALTRPSLPAPNGGSVLVECSLLLRPTERRHWQRHASEFQRPKLSQRLPTTLRRWPRHAPGEAFRRSMTRDAAFGARAGHAQR